MTGWNISPARTQRASGWTNEARAWLLADVEQGHRVAGGQFAEDIIEPYALLASRVYGDQFEIDLRTL